MELINTLKTAGIADNNYINLKNNLRVSIPNFIKLFGTTDGSYEALIAADDNGDGTKKGYSSYFNDWHSKGLI